MKHEQITIEAKDGKCNAFVVAPDGAGPWPAVIMYMDAFGIRPAMKQMAEHIASEGYVVLLPDLFYRFGSYGPLDPKVIFASGDFKTLIAPMMASTDNHRAAEDTRSFIAYLDSRKDVSRAPMGTIGFCMGGGMAVTAAAWFPERIGAVASFHGGRLATDEPTSPHLQVHKIKGEVYIAGADKDQGYTPEMAERLEKAFVEGHVRHKQELYTGKLHGWMKPDMPVYDAEGAARGWRELFALYKRNLHT